MRPPPDAANPLAGGDSHDGLILWMAAREAGAALEVRPGATPPPGR